jgi:hypothetical protein
MVAIRLVAEVFGHLLGQPSFQHRLGQLREQPSGPVNDKRCSLASRTNSAAARS